MRRLNHYEIVLRVAGSLPFTIGGQTAPSRPTPDTGTELTVRWSDKDSGTAKRKACAQHGERMGRRLEAVSCRCVRASR